MNTFLEELVGGIPDWTQLERVIIQLVAAMVIGGVIGFQRERAGKSTGLRTHMLVAMGSALFRSRGRACHDVDERFVAGEFRVSRPPSVLSGRAPS